jgi:hypothetical protein
MKLRVLVVHLLIVAGASARHDGAVMAQAPTAAPIWTGSIRCDIDIKGPGYVNHQTHTWTLTGAIPPGGGVLDYPATWSVSGEGSLLPTTSNNASATWKTQGSAAGVRLGIFVRADRQVVVLARHGQLNVPNGTTGVRLGAPPATPVPIAATVSEWRPFPTIVDAAASTHITGRSVTPATERLDALQPAGSQGQASCSWDLAQMGSSAVSSATVPPASAVAGANPAGGAPASARVAVSGTVPAAAAPARGNAGTAIAVAPGTNAGATAAPVAPAAATGTIAEGAAATRDAGPGGTAATTPIPHVCSRAGEKVVNVTRGQNASVAGVIGESLMLDWITVHFNPGTSVHVTLSGADASGSEFHVRTYGDCATPLAAAAGSGVKTLDFPDSGPHTIVLRIHANPYDAARSAYTLRLEGR